MERIKNAVFHKLGAAALAGMLAAMPFIAGCGSSSGSSTADSSAETAAAGETSSAAGSSSSDKIRIGVLKTADSFPLYAAQEKGYYEQNGLEVELDEFGSASEQSQAMEAGQIDVMMTDMIVECLIRKGGTGIRTVRTALGSDVTQGKFIIASAPDSGITKPADLAEAKIGISENTMMEFLVDSYFDELGISEDGVSKVNVPNLSLRYEMVMAGEDIDAAILPDPLGDYSVSNGANCVIDDTKLKNNYSISVITASEELIADTSRLDRFLASYDEAVKAINDNPDDFKELILEKTNVPADMQESYQVPVYAYQQVPGEEEVSRVTDWMTGKGLLDEAYSYEDIVKPMDDAQ